MKRIRIRTFAYAFHAMLIAGCVASPTMTTSNPSGVPIVKILLARGLDSLHIHSAAPMLVRTSGKTFNVSAVILRAINDSTIGVMDQAVDACEIFPTDSALHVDGSPYRGSVKILPQEKKLSVINVLDMESYLQGVVKLEIGKLPLEQIEASKAQAIAARTYAYAKKHSGGEYDLVSDVNDQVYGGIAGESEVSNRAVRETAGWIATYQGAPIRAFYYSSSGGTTANVRDVWPNSQTFPYLRSVSVNVLGKNYSRESPHHRWTVSWSGEEITALIKSNLPRVFPQRDYASLADQELYNLRVLERDSSQRIHAFEIGFRTSKDTVTGEQLRRVLRGERSILYSSLFRIDVRRAEGGAIDSVTATGTGYGHGVGMCQWSARAMAKDGWSASQILKFFYRGCEMGRVY